MEQLTKQDIVKRVSKWELRNLLGYTNRVTFNKALKTLTTDKDCPFTYDQIKDGHFIKGLWVKYICENL